MISAWRKFINREGNDPTLTGQSANGMPPGIQKLDRDLQRKFARGVNYNMKVVIKGDNRVGKTSLFMRLKGYDFDDNYKPTDALNVTSIDWDYKATDDIVKIDLWEAIDSLSSKKNVNVVDLLSNPKQQETNLNNNKTNNGTNDKSHVGQDANGQSVSSTGNNDAKNNIPESIKQSFAELNDILDVYKGAHAVLLVMDMTKNWTFKYIQNEMTKIPKHIPVLIIGNNRDQGHHRTVAAEQVHSFIHGLDRDPSDGIVMYTEASMKNGFGLNLIKKFLNIPFLKLQESTLLKQLELNRCEFMSTQEELQLMQDSINKEYEQYLEIQTIRRRQLADAMSPVNSGLRQLNETAREQIRSANVSSDTLDKSNLKSFESKPMDKPSEPETMAKERFVNDRLASIVIGAKCPLPEMKSTQMSAKTTAQTMSSMSESRANNQSANSNIMTTDSITSQVGGDDEDDSDDEDETPRANPLVANYQSDLDSDDQCEKNTSKP